jgi:hypothetical protein
MTYTKPEVEVLGKAEELVQQPSQKHDTSTDFNGKVAAPAYDLDE